MYLAQEKNIISLRFDCCYIALPENVSTLYSQTLIYEFHSFPIFDNLKDKSCILFYFASLIE